MTLATPYAIDQPFGRPYEVTATGLVVGGATIFYGLSIRNREAAAAFDVQVEDGSAAGGIFVTALSAAALTSPTPVWATPGILLERGCFVTITGTFTVGTSRAAIWATPLERVRNLDIPFASDVFGAQVQ